MKKSCFQLLLLPIFFGLILSCTVQAQSYSGTLEPGDPKLDAGEYFDSYYIDVSVGQHIDAVLTSSTFDTYLILVPPTIDNIENDDYGDASTSRVETAVEEGGEWRVLVTSYDAGETGDYDLVITITSGAFGPESSDGYSGDLGPGDPKLESGEYYDTYYVDVVAGQKIGARLSSDEFDTYVIIQSPSGEVTENDDFEGLTSMSYAEVIAGESGEWKVLATTYAADLTGSYTLTVSTSGASPGEHGRPSGETTTYSGDLGPGDAKLTSGEYYDTYYFDVEAGRNITASLVSSDFDTYVIIRSPSGESTENDDLEGSTGQSLAEVAANQNGEWSVIVTSFTEGETGSYVLSVTLGESSAHSTPGVRIESDQLGTGDSTLSSGEYVDDYSFEGTEGERVVIDLRSTEFDPYLMLVAPDYEQFDNDDHEGNATHSQLSMVLTQSGSYLVRVTSYRPEEEGTYTLTISQGDAVQATTGTMRESGDLSAGDNTLRSGEYYDAYDFEGVPGQNVHIDLNSNEFDTYVILKLPSGEQVENDDVDEMPGHSIVDHELNESGTHTVVVTSYQPEETGAYNLVIEPSEGTFQPDRRQDVSNMVFGDQVTGTLEEGDSQLESGEYLDLYSFDGTAGDNIVIEMNSSDFDTYLGLATPGAEVFENDDYEGSTSVSRIEFQLPESGRYRITATSYTGGMTGEYSVSLNTGGTPVRPPVPSGDGELYGLFVGISEYGGRMGDLSYTAEDAVRVHDALVQGAGMQPNNGIVLTNARATRAQFQNALQTLSGRMNPNDTFMLFYSGHGGRYERSNWESTDPDGLDESLELYDTEILDNELSGILDSVPAGKQILIFDSCFSGGFAKDVISKPGRMGMFSSEEDVTSSVAAKFRAGGYLALFFADAVGDTLADEDGDSAVSANELRYYISERYRGEVKSSASDYVSTGRQLGYQRLSVDLGSISPFDILFRQY